jgi:hypothetical protein
MSTCALCFYIKPRCKQRNSSECARSCRRRPPNGAPQMQSCKRDIICCRASHGQEISVYLTTTNHCTSMPHMQATDGWPPCMKIRFLTSCGTTYCFKVLKLKLQAWDSLQHSTRPIIAMKQVSMMRAMLLHGFEILVMGKHNGLGIMVNWVTEGDHCSPFSGTSRTTWATWLDNGPIHMGQPTLAKGVIVPVPHGSAEGVLYPLWGISSRVGGQSLKRGGNI